MRNTLEKAEDEEVFAIFLESFPDAMAVETSFLAVRGAPKSFVFSDNHMEHLEYPSFNLCPKNNFRDQTPSASVREKEFLKAVYFVRSELRKNKNHASCSQCMRSFFRDYLR